MRLVIQCANLHSAMVYYERNLPHWQPDGKYFFLTWRLHGSLPAPLLNSLRESGQLKSGKGFVRYDRELDEATFGPTWLRNAEIAKAVADCILSAMPNHVHILLEPKAALKQITRPMKGRSARDCNRILHRTGAAFWHEETYDHWVRSPQSFERIRNHIEWNPVRAKLVESPEEWPWSSASGRSRLT